MESRGTGFWISFVSEVCGWGYWETWVVMEVSRLFGLGKWFVLEEVLDGTAELQSLDVPVSKAESAILDCQVESHDHQIA